MPLNPRVMAVCRCWCSRRCFRPLEVGPCGAPLADLCELTHRVRVARRARAAAREIQRGFAAGLAGDVEHQRVSRGLRIEYGDVALNPDRGHEVVFDVGGADSTFPSFSGFVGRRAVAAVEHRFARRTPRGSPGLEIVGDRHRDHAEELLEGLDVQREPGVDLLVEHQLGELAARVSTSTKTNSSRSA